ncbi:MchC protein [Gibbsiella quercinecans]|uniref:MchC protein n=1 Tax=Gibbsiella quercinecans TaxID=929813 RepID=UPI000EF2585C|nr:MchC protein [Gibbsiella quercinecans]RLM06682.1 MchC protein [Gibbsiella quercinecans]
MSHPPSLSDLTANLVPFAAHQATSSLIWCAADVDDGEALRESCSYLVAPSLPGTVKIFQAERYGGSGIQSNGGGARCGFDGCHQIKGIGANPLVGEGSDWHHTNGALGANQAIYEAMWGEILAQSLPYGAVRTRAVLLTDSYIDLEFERARGRSRRALLVREPVVRPAHFERAPYFRPQAEYAQQLMHDAHRVRSVIRLLPASLPTPPAGFSKEATCDPQRRCLEGLCELAKRQARQMAFCRTRFLMLTTSPSNIAMDGRVLDFNGLTSLFPSDHRYDFEYQLKLAQLMSEPAILLQGLSDLSLYLGKYLFDRAFTVFAQQQLDACFWPAYQDACYRGYLALLGIPVDLLSPTEMPKVLEQLVNSFVHLMSCRSKSLYCSSDAAIDESPLERLVMTLIHRSQGQKVPDCDDLLRDAHFSQTLRAFTEANHWLVDTCRIQGIDVADTQNNMAQQACLRLQPRACLGKVRMLKDIAELLETYGDDVPLLRQALSAMEAKTLAFAKGAFGCQPSFSHVAREHGKT